MQRYNMDSNPNTLENELVNRIRLCLKKHCWRDEYHRANLKEAISELRTFRTNREINPELHAKLDSQAVKAFHSSGLLTHNPANWEIYCRNKARLTRQRLDETTQETLIDGIPVPVDKSKGRVRETAPAEKIDTDYFTRTKADIENGKLTPYLPVRQMSGFFTNRDEQNAFIQRVRTLADAERDHLDHSRDYKRIHRVASRILKELHEDNRQGLLF